MRDILAKVSKASKQTVDQIAGTATLLEQDESEMMSRKLLYPEDFRCFLCVCV